MDRRLLLLPVALGLAVGLAWQLGFLGPKAGGSEDGPVVEADGPSLAGAPAEAGAPGAAEALALARGGTKPVAKTKAPTIDGPRVTGHVTDRAGKPVPDAHVLSIPDSTIKYFLAKDLGTPGCPAADAVTDEKGAFVVAVGKDAPAHAIVVEAASFGTAMESGVQAGADVTIVLDASATIHGTVTGSDGTAVVGAKVRVVGSFDAYRVELEAVSGPAGAYRLEGLPAAKKDKLGANPYAPAFSSVVEVTADTFAPLLTNGVGGLEPGKDKLRDFVLVHGAVVAGTVVDAETAAPIEGARVVLYSNEADNQGVSTARSGGTYLPNVISPRTLAETTSAKDGTFQFDHVPSQGFHAALSQNWGRKGPSLGAVAAWKDGYCAASDDVGFQKDGARQETTLKLWPAAIVVGRVVLADGKPVPKVSVYSDNKQGAAYLPPTLFPDAPTAYGPDIGPDGRYRITGLAVPRGTATDVKLTARVVQQGPFQEWNEAGDGSVTVAAKAGDTVTAPDLVLKADGIGPAIPIEVVDPDGRPVWGATVGPNEMWMGGGGARTDAAGHVSIPLSTKSGRPPTLTMTARAKGWAPTPFTLTAGSLDLVRVTLKPAHRLTGRVLLSDRTPAVGASMQLADGAQPIDQVFPAPTADGSAMRMRRSISPGGSGRPTGPTGFAFTDDQGRFLFEGLAEGPYHLLATRGGKGISSGGKPLARATLANVATDATDLEIVLPIDEAQPTGGVEGTVVDGATGRPVPGLSVALRRGEEVGGTAMQQRGGMMMAPGVMGGLAGSVTSPGRYEIPSAVAGTWALTASADGFRPRTVEGITIRPGETTTVPPIALDHGTTVRGRVTVPDGATMADRMVGFQDTASEPGKERWITADVATDGTFTVAGFTAGVWKLSSYKQGYSEKQEPPLLSANDQKLEIHDGDSEVRYDVNLVAAGSLGIQPADDRLPPARWEGGGGTDAQKKFGEACKVTVLDAAGAVVAEQKGIRRNDAGKLSWLQVLPGHYVVRLELPGGETREEAADVTAGGQVQVHLAKK